jgi:hypothetical protein
MDGKCMSCGNSVEMAQCMAKLSTVMHQHRYPVSPPTAS